MYFSFRMGLGVGGVKGRWLFFYSLREEEDYPNTLT